MPCIPVWFSRTRSSATRFSSVVRNLAWIGSRGMSQKVTRLNARDLIQVSLVA